MYEVEEDEEEIPITRPWSSRKTTTSVPDPKSKGVAISQEKRKMKDKEPQVANIPKKKRKLPLATTSGSKKAKVYLVHYSHA